MAIVGNDPAGKIFQNRLLGQIARIIVVFQQVDDADNGARLAELLGNGPADAFAPPVTTTTLFSNILIPPVHSPARTRA